MNKLIFCHNLFVCPYNKCFLDGNLLLAHRYLNFMGYLRAAVTRKSEKLSDKCFFQIKEIESEVLIDSEDEFMDNDGKSKKKSIVKKRMQKRV